MCLVCNSVQISRVHSSFVLVFNNKHDLQCYQLKLSTSKNDEGFLRTPENKTIFFLRGTGGHAGDVVADDEDREGGGFLAIGPR